MDLVPFLIGAAVGGLILGALARLALPGPDPLSLLQTMGVGLAASFLSGLVVYLITDGAAGPGFLVSFTFAVVIMYFIRRRRGGGLLSPGEHAPRKPGPYER